VTARVLATHIWPADASAPLAVPELDLDWGGAIGDRHYGETMQSNARQKYLYERGTQIRNHRQLSIVDFDELTRIAAALGIEDLAAGVIADNICTAGIPDLTSLPGLTRLVFDGGAVLVTGGENTPCTIAGQMVTDRYGPPAEAFPKAAMGLRGIVAWVDRPAPIRPDEGIRLVPPSRM
jgi:hypothetical protein